MPENEYNRILEEERRMKGNVSIKAVLEELRILRKHIIELKEKVDKLKK